MTIKLIKQVNKQELIDFDCGSEELNAFLKCYAHQNDKNRLGRSFVLFEENVPVGYKAFSVDQDPDYYKTHEAHDRSAGPH